MRVIYAGGTSMQIGRQDTPYHCTEARGAQQNRGQWTRSATLRPSFSDRLFRRASCCPSSMPSAIWPKPCPRARSFGSPSILGKARRRGASAGLSSSPCRACSPLMCTWTRQIQPVRQVHRAIVRERGVAKGGHRRPHPLQRGRGVFVPN